MLYTVKLDIVSATKMCQGVLQKSYQYAVGFLKRLISGATNSVFMLLKKCVTYDRCNHNIRMLLKNSNNMSDKFYHTYMFGKY